MNTSFWSNSKWPCAPSAKVKQTWRELGYQCTQEKVSRLDSVIKYYLPFTWFNTKTRCLKIFIHIALLLIYIFTFYFWFSLNSRNIRQLLYVYLLRPLFVFGLLNQRGRVITRFVVRNATAFRGERCIFRKLHNFFGPRETGKEIYEITIFHFQSSLLLVDRNQFISFSKERQSCYEHCVV